MLRQRPQAASAGAWARLRHGVGGIDYHLFTQCNVAAALGQSPAAQGALPLQGSQCRGWNGGLFPADLRGMPVHGVDVHTGRSVTRPRSRVLRPPAAPNCRRAPRFSGQKPAMRPRNGLQNTRATPVAGQNLQQSARKRPRKLAGHTENLRNTFWAPAQTAAGGGALGPGEALFRVGRDPNEPQLGPYESVKGPP